MQLNSVYLYPNKIDVFTNALASWKTERYSRVYNRNLKVYRGVDNKVDLQVRNSDEKSADITGSVLVFNIYSRDAKDLVLQRDCVADTLATGKVNVILSQNDLLYIESGYYNYAVFQEVRTNIDPDHLDLGYRVSSRTPMYIDGQYGVKSTMEIIGDVLVDPVESLVVNKFNYINPIPLGYTDAPYNVSSIIDAQPQLETAQSLHTFSFYCSQFHGKIIIQGSLDESSTPAAGNWVNIPDSAISPGTNNFDPAGTPVTYKNVVGKWNWFRIYQTAHQGTSAVFTVQQTTIGNYIVDIDSGGANYSVGERVFIAGVQIGGVSGVNDLLITVTEIDANGAVVNIEYSGSSSIGYRSWVIDAYKDANSGGTLDKVLYR